MHVSFVSKFTKSVILKFHLYQQFLSETFLVDKYVGKVHTKFVLKYM
jgi:hypothetical protein